jgi:hypothetical protein
MNWLCLMNLEAKSSIWNFAPSSLPCNYPPAVAADHNLLPPERGPAEALPLQLPFPGPLYGIGHIREVHSPAVHKGDEGDVDEFDHFLEERDVVD